MTAEKFIEATLEGWEEQEGDKIPFHKVEQLMINFAKYHSELALISAAEEASVSMKEGMDYYYEDYVEGVNKASILNAYPLENIK